LLDNEHALHARVPHCILLPSQFVSANRRALSPSTSTVLVASCSWAVEPNLVWKDRALVRTGETVDILLDVTNAGVWMPHCHLAEHQRAIQASPSDSAGHLDSVDLADGGGREVRVLAE
jgi:FtsP/CotA-like multicopper oxidase with cupredoxin domain